MELNKIYNIDCLEFMKGMESNSVDLVLTDPPYLYLKHKLDRAFDEELFFSEAFRILKDDSFICYFGRGASFYKWGYICQQLGFEFLEELIWDKVRISSPFGNIMRQHETIAVWRKGSKQLNKIHIDKIEYDLQSGEVQKLISDNKRIMSDLKKINTFEDFEKWKTEKTETKHKHSITAGDIKKAQRGLSTLKSYQNGKVLSSIIRVNREHYTMEHPTQKPLELMDILVKLCSSENEIIFDPFLGSGSTAIACLNTNRNYIGCEIDKEYFEIATKRIENQKKINKSKLFYCKISQKNICNKT